MHKIVEGCLIYVLDKVRSPASELLQNYVKAAQLVLRWLDSFQINFVFDSKLFQFLFRKRFTENFHYETRLIHIQNIKKNYLFVSIRLTNKNLPEESLMADLS